MNPIYIKIKKIQTRTRVLLASLLLLSTAHSSAQSFSSQSSATFPNPPTGTKNIIADFDGDGDADILFQTGVNGSPFSYARNNHNGTFTTVAQAASPFAGLTLPDVTTFPLYRTEDFDGDGDIDVWVPVNSGTGTYFRNDGSSFSSQSTTTFPNAQAQARNIVADFDGDGDADVLFQTGLDGTSFSYARNLGNATFTILAQAASPFAGLTLPNASQLSTYRTADFDGDGDIDVWATANGGTGTYFRNDGSSFSSQLSTFFPAAQFGGRNVIGDFDADGDADILSQTLTNGSPFLYAKSNGNGTFTTVIQALSPFAGLTLADVNTYGYYKSFDFDGDGDIDVWMAADNATGAYLMQNGSPLPLYWLNLHAVFVNDQVSINWKTTDERHTSHFIVERSTDGVSFTRIGQTASANTPGEHQYAFDDKEVQHGYTYYYRIKQVDIDGRFNFSSIVKVNMEGERIAELKVRNNPVQADMVIAITLPEAQQARLILVNPAGAIVLDRKENLQAGETIMSVRTSKLPKGIYYLVLYAGSDKLRTSLIKQ